MKSRKPKGGIAVLLAVNVEKLICDMSEGCRRGR